MCGIFGLAVFEDSPLDARVIRSILKKLTISSKIRGRDATGYAFMKKDGAQVFKHNVFADRFVKLSNYKEVVRNNVPAGNLLKDLYSVIGHTRAETQGSHTNPKNNHPITTGGVIGVHNGMISNDDDLFTWLDGETNKKNRIAEVDSEIIFSLINYYAKVSKFPATYRNSNLIGHYTNPTTKAIKRVCPRLKGSFACAMVDSDNPKTLWLFKGKNTSLAVNYYADERIVVFASVEKFINEAISESFNFSHPKRIPVGDDSGLCINVEDVNYNTFSIENSKA